MSQIDPKSLWGVRGDMDISPTKFQNILCSKTFEFRHAQYPVALYERHCSRFGLAALAISNDCYNEI